MSIVLLLIKATMLLAAALLFARLLSRGSAGSRHLVWLVSLVALLSLPAFAAWSPLRLHILPTASVLPLAGPDAGAVVLGNTAPPAAAPSASHAIAGADNHVAAPAPLSIRIAIFAGAHRVGVIFAIWGGVVLLLILWLAYGSWSVHRIVRRATELTDPDWQRPLYDIADRLAIARAPRILRSNDVRMPFAAGVFHPVVVLPPDSSAWSIERRTAVLIHELAHIRRRDLIGHTVGRVACALYWFHPMVWGAARRLRAESERACDDLALAFGERPSEYAEHLLEIVTCVRDHATPSVALAMAHRKEFEGRMLAILDPDQRREAPGKRATLSLVGGLAVVAVMVSAASPVAPVPVPVSTTRHIPADSVATLADRAPTMITPKGSAHSHESARVEDAANPAITAINSLPRSERVAILARLLRNDSSESVRRVAAWGLKEFANDPAAVAALAAALGSDHDADVRKMAAWAMENAGGAVGTAALIHAAHSDAADDVRETSVWALAEGGDSAAATACHAAIGDRSENVRATCAWAIGYLRVPHMGPTLLVALHDSSSDVRERAAWALGEAEDSAALPGLRAAMRGEKSSDVMKMEMRALVRSGEDPSRMVEWLRSSDPEVRQMAAAAIAGGAASDPMPRPEPRPIPFP